MLGNLHVRFGGLVGKVLMKVLTRWLATLPKQQAEASSRCPVKLGSTRCCAPVKQVVSAPG